MKKIVVSIYDIKTRSWSDLITLPNLPTAIRMVEQMVRREGSIHSQYPQDFVLYQVAETREADDGQLDIVTLSPHSRICGFADFFDVNKPIGKE